MVEPRFYIIIDENQQTPNEETLKPNLFILEQNFPNPFNPSTRINYSLHTAGKVNLTVYSVDGRKVAELVNSNKGAGNHSVIWDASGLSSGVYIYRLTSSSHTTTKR